VWTPAKKPSEEDRALADEARPKEAKECEADYHQQFASRRSTIGPAASRFLPCPVDLSRAPIYLVNSVSCRSRKKEDPASYCPYHNYA
jgi:hypothetical protein